MQRAEKTTALAIGKSPYNNNYKERSEYDGLLSEAIKLGRQHQTKAKYYVPKMYNILVKKEGLIPADAADRIYKDLVGIWQKDTIRRLLPLEAKNHIARERQAMSRRSLLVSKAGLILQASEDDANSSSNNNNKLMIIELEKENARLRKKVEDLNALNRSQLERILRLEKAITMPLQKGTEEQEQKATTMMLPPHLFMKAFTLMRSCMKPLVLKVEGGEVIDIDRSRE